MKTIEQAVEQIKLDLTEQSKCGMISAKVLKKSLEYLERNAEEYGDMVLNQGCRVSDAADLVVQCRNF